MSEENHLEFLEKRIAELEEENRRLKAMMQPEEWIRQQNELKAREEKYRILFEESNDGIVIFDMKGRIQEINSTAETMLGYTKADLKGIKIQTLYPESDRHIFRQASKEVKTHGHAHFEIHLIRNNGTMMDGDISASIVDPDNGLIQGIVRDITDRKILESRLQQAQKMEAIGTLAGGIAHDFNNILFPIMGHAEMLLADIPPESPEAFSIKEIYAASNRAKELIHQILTFSRQTTGELKLMKIQPIVKEALKFIRSSIPTTIAIHHDIDPACPPIKADPTQIHQIVMNLTTNAFHAMEENGGEMTVSLHRIALCEDDDFFNTRLKPGSYAYLKVSDTGMGIPDEIVEKVFDPFFTTKKEGKGTGMGLSVVHGIVETLEGDIRVESRPGEGSTFHVYLPIAESYFQQQTPTPKKETQKGTEHILLIDDEAPIIQMEKRMLERLGYQVTARTSSLEALEIFKNHSHRFQLVITDMSMPNLSGEKLAVVFKKINPEVPILVCTGFSDLIGDEKMTRLGIDGLLLKPIVMSTLSEKIREVLNHKLS